MSVLSSWVHSSRLSFSQTVSSCLVIVRVRFDTVVITLTMPFFNTFASVSNFADEYTYPGGCKQVLGAGFVLAILHSVTIGDRAVRG